MKKIIGGLMIFLAGAMLVGCGENSAGQSEIRVAQIGNNQEACESEKGTAVSINFSHVNGVLSDDVRVEYRKDGGAWTLLDEHASGSVFIPGTGGTYEIKAQKKGYVLESALVIVPNDIDCGVLKQEVGFIFTPAACMDVIPIVINVVKPEIPETLGLSIHPPGQEPMVQPCLLGRCFFNLTPSNDGIYEVEFSGFPNLKEPILTVGEIVRYAYTPVEILVSVGDRKHHIVSEAVERLRLGIPYEVGESGCYEVDFDGVTAEFTGISSPESGLGGIHAGPTFHVFPLGSDECKQTPQIKQVSFVMEVPTGTALENVKVDYWNNGDWHMADCRFEGNYVCRAEFNNPFTADKYHVRTTIKKNELTSSYISLWDKCMVFD